MRIRFKFPLLFIPFLGGFLGYAWAFIFVNGLFVPWHFVGKPSEKISNIIGFVGGHDLFVETVSGNIYSLEYLNYLNGKDSLPLPIKWKKEENRIYEPDPIRKSYVKFLSLPLLVKTKQLYEKEFPIIEGHHLVKFVLSEDGNLWMWNYGVGGLSVLTYLIYPIIGLFYGFIFALLIRTGIFIWRIITNRRFSHQIKYSERSG